MSSDATPRCASFCWWPSGFSRWPRRSSRSSRHDGPGRGGVNELRRLLKGKPERPEFRPFVRDVREFVDRILTETERDRESGSWTPERLKHALNRYLHGEKIVILANREPYIHERAGDGSIKVVHPASGLVTALEPVMRACSGVWVAHGSGTADRDTVDAHDRVAVPPGEESYFIRRLWLTPEEEKGYYYGFANEGLWPLCHLAHARPVFRREDWETLPGRQPAIRGRGLRGGRFRRSDRPRPGLSLRAGAQAHSRAPAPRDDHHVLAHSVAELGAARDLPVAQRAARGHARREHCRLSHAVALQ